ncbi:MAG: hypothetical protein GAK39_06198 [Variovorax sp.]|nr:MAG: hypothetical protein GAK39_06198 [Variovorax sp.]
MRNSHFTPSCERSPHGPSPSVFLRFPHRARGAWRLARHGLRRRRHRGPGARRRHHGPGRAAQDLQHRRGPARRRARQLCRRRGPEPHDAAGPGAEQAIAGAAGQPWRARSLRAPARGLGARGRWRRGRCLCAAPGRGRHRERCRGRHARTDHRHGGPGAQRHQRGHALLCRAAADDRQGRAGGEGHPAVGQRAHAPAARRPGPRRPARRGQCRHRRGRREGRGAGHGAVVARLPDRRLAVRRRAGAAQLVFAGQLGHRGAGVPRPPRGAARRGGPAAGHGQPGRRRQPGAQARPVREDAGADRQGGQLEPLRRAARRGRAAQCRGHAARARGDRRGPQPFLHRFRLEPHALALWRDRLRPDAGHHPRPGHQPDEGQRPPHAARLSALSRRQGHRAASLGVHGRLVEPPRQRADHPLCRPGASLQRELEAQGLGAAHERAQCLAAPAHARQRAARRQRAELRRLGQPVRFEEGGPRRLRARPLRGAVDGARPDGRRELRQVHLEGPLRPPLHERRQHLRARPLPAGAELRDHPRGGRHQEPHRVRHQPVGPVRQLAREARGTADGDPRRARELVRLPLRRPHPRHPQHREHQRQDHALCRPGVRARPAVVGLRQRHGGVRTAVRARAERKRSIGTPLRACA